MCIYHTDEASDLEACRMLTDNATNIISAILEALNYTRSASIRVAVETRKELGLTHYVETDPITGELSQYHKVSN